MYQIVYIYVCMRIWSYEKFYDIYMIGYEKFYLYMHNVYSMYVVA
jgi:hypothetical protein